MIFSLNRPLILIGMPGCGKTALGRIVAEKLGLPFLDIDKCIFEQTGKDSAEHLRSKGDQGFLKFEGHITESLDIRNKTYEENCDIYLKVSREAPKEVNAGRIIDGLEKYLQNEQS